MAKILAKKSNSYNQNQLIKVRHTLDFYQEEIDSLEEKYQEIIDRKLNSFLIKGNKKLSKLAFQACDKEEYAQQVLDDKLQKYDVNAYMKHRAANHGAAKEIFKLSKKGEPFGHVLVDRDKKISNLNNKRAKYLSSLEESKAKFLEKHKTANAAPYKTEREKLEKEYYLIKESLEKKYSAKLLDEKSKLQEKITKAEKKASNLKAKLKNSYALPDDVLLEVKGLKMYFGGLKAVDDLTFNVKKGEIFGLIGPNGAGKTTVFNCITRFYDATGGEMYFENKYGEVVDLRDFKVHDIILQGIGRTFQNIELVREISVMENLLVASTRSYKTGFWGHMIGLPSLKKEEKLLRAKAMRILKFMGL